MKLKYALFAALLTFSFSLAGCSKLIKVLFKGGSKTASKVTAGGAAAGAVKHADDVAVGSKAVRAADDVAAEGAHAGRAADESRLADGVADTAATGVDVASDVVGDDEEESAEE